MREFGVWIETDSFTAHLSGTVLNFRILMKSLWRRLCSRVQTAQQNHSRRSIIEARQTPITDRSRSVGPGLPERCPFPSRAFRSCRTILFSVEPVPSLSLASSPARRFVFPTTLRTSSWFVESKFLKYQPLAHFHAIHRTIPFLQPASDSDAERNSVHPAVARTWFNCALPATARHWAKNFKGPPRPRRLAGWVEQIPPFVCGFIVSSSAACGGLSLPIPDQA
ncbi:hypothetical protein B0H12DRAFT_376766 [Mycena haematopus]|nr:hypothetical protein B0H12DRAFT_376766 [Mycena haematopus]